MGALILGVFALMIWAYIGMLLPHPLAPWFQGAGTIGAGAYVGKKLYDSILRPI